MVSSGKESALQCKGHWFNSLIWEDPTGRRAADPVHHNQWACSLEPKSHNHWAHRPQLLKPEHPEGRALCQETPLQRERSRAKQQRPRAAENKYFLKYCTMTYMGEESRKEHMYIWLRIADSLCCTEETNATLQTNSTPIKNLWKIRVCDLNSSTCDGLG